MIRRDAPDRPWETCFACNYDRHVCSGCGIPTTHKQGFVCPECSTDSQYDDDLRRIEGWSPMQFELNENVQVVNPDSVYFGQTGKVLGSSKTSDTEKYVLGFDNDRFTANFTAGELKSERGPR